MKIFKKIIILILIFLLLLVDVWILDGIEDRIIKSGVINNEGKTVVDFKYVTIDAPSLFEGYKYIKAFKDDLFGSIKEVDYIDMEGNEYLVSLRKDDFQEIRPNYVEDIAIVANGDLNKGGYLDIDGNFITEIKYDYCDDFDNGYAVVGIGEDEDVKYGLINREGKEIIPCMYDKIDTVASEANIFYVTLSKEYYIVDNTNKRIARYDEDDNIEFLNLGDLTKLGKLKTEDVNFTNDIVIVKKDNKYGFFSKDGNQLVDFKFDEVKEISRDNRFLVEIDGKRLITDANNEYTFDCSNIEKDGLIVESIDSIENNRLRVIKDKKMGVVDLDGKFIINPEYDNVSVQTTKKGYFSVQKGNEHGVYNLDGKEIIACSNKYKTPIVGDGEYFVTAKVNSKLLAMWITYIAITLVLEIILVILLFKRKK